MSLLYVLWALTLAGQAEGISGRSSTLAGKIWDEQGRPIAGTKVFIRAATPRQGVGVL